MNRFHSRLPARSPKCARSDFSAWVFRLSDDEMNGAGLRMAFRNPLNGSGECVPFPIWCRVSLMATGPGLHDAEDVCGSSTDVFVVALRYLSRTCSTPRPLSIDQLDRSLIKADDGLTGILGLCV